MPTATVTSKGQVTIPKEVREHLRLATGDRLEFTIAPGRGRGASVEIRRRGRSIGELAGLLHRPGVRPPTPEEMRASMIDRLAEEDERIRRGER